MASMSAGTANIAIGSTGNVIALTGVSTTWTSGTTFTVTGGTGASITAHTNNSGTSESITVSAGTAYGALTISDGTNTCTVTVGPAVTASKTVTVAPYPTLSPATMSTIFATPAELWTVAQRRQMEHACEHVPGGGDPTRTLGSLFN